MWRNTWLFLTSLNMVHVIHWSQFIIFASFVICCTRATENSRLCFNIPPGIERLRWGVDLTKFTLFPSTEEQKLNQLKAPIIDFTCSEGKKHSYQNAGQEHDLPDEISSFFNSKVGNVTWNVKNHTNLQYFYSKNDTFGKGNKFNILHSKIRRSRELRNRFLKESVIATDCSGNLTFYKVIFKPSFMLPLGKSAQTLLDKIDPVSEKSYDDYMNFIQHFGTHYIYEADMGGQISIRLLANHSQELQYNREFERVRKQYF